MTKKISKKTKEYKKVSDESPFSEIRSVVMLKGRRKLSPLSLYKQHIAHKDLDLNTRDSLLFKALSRDGVNLTQTQIDFLNFFHSSKVSYYSYLQSRLLNIGAISTAFMGKSLQGINSNPSLFAGDRYVFDLILNGAHSGSKSFSGSVADMTVNGIRAVAKFQEVIDGLGADQLQILKNGLEHIKKNNCLPVKVAAKDGRVEITSDFQKIIASIAQALEKTLIVTKDGRGNTSGEQLYSSGVRGAIQVMTTGLEAASIALDERTVPSQEALDRVATYRNDIFGKLTISKNSGLWAYLFSIKSADISALTGSYDGVIADGSTETVLNLPILRRGQLTSLDLFQQFVTYLLLLGYGINNTLISGLYSLFNVDAKSLKFSADSSQKDIVSLLYSKVEDITTTMTDKDGTYRTLTYDKAVASSFFGEFLLQEGSVVLKNTTPLSNEGRIANSDINTNSALTGLPTGIYIENNPKNACLCNPVSMLAFSIYEVLNLTQKDGSSNFDGTYSKDSGIFKGKSDLSRENSDVARTFSQVYSAMQIVLAGLNKFGTVIDRYSPTSFNNTRNSFKMLLTNLESATTTDAALNLVSSFLASDPSWNSSIASVIYSFYKATLLSNDVKLTENSADVMINRILYTYNTVVSPISGRVAVSNYNVGFKLRTAMGIKDIVITSQDNEIIGSTGDNVGDSVSSEFIKREFQSLLTCLRANAGADKLTVISTGIETESFRKHLALLAFKESNNLIVYRRSLTGDSSVKLVDKYNLPTVVKDQVLQTLREIDSALAAEFGLVKEAYQQSINFEVLSYLNPIILFLEKYGELKGTLFSVTAATEKIDANISELKKAIHDLLIATDVDEAIIGLWDGTCEFAVANAKPLLELSTYKDHGVDLKRLLELLQTSIMNVFTNDNLKTWLVSSFDTLREVSYRPPLVNVPLETLSSITDLIALTDNRYSSGCKFSSGKNETEVPLSERFQPLVHNLIDRAVEEVQDLYGSVNADGYSVSMLNQITISSKGLPKYQLGGNEAKRFQPEGEDLPWTFSPMNFNNSSGLLNVLKQVGDYAIELKKRDGLLPITEIVSQVDHAYGYYGTMMTYCTKQFNPVSKILAREPIIINAVSQSALKGKVGDILGIGTDTIYSRESARSLAKAIILHHEIYGSDSVIRPTDKCTSYAFDESVEGIKGGALFELTKISEMQDFLTYSITLWRFEEVIEQTARRSSIFLANPSQIEVAMAELSEDGRPQLHTLNYGKLAIAKLYSIPRSEGFRPLTRSEAKSVDSELLYDMTNELLNLIV